MFNKYTDKVVVAKAFNNVSAFSMNFNYTTKSVDDMIMIANDDSITAGDIIHLANQIGFRACHLGPLKKARILEQLNETIFLDWQSPTIFAISFLVFNLIWYFFYSYFSNAKYSNFDQYLDAFSLLAYLNRVFAFTSINLLAYVYLAGLVATIYQLHYATKTKRFPKYLDLWLKSRKHLGLWAFFYASMHLIITLCILTPAYFSPWYKPMSQVKLSASSFTFNNQTSIFDINTKNGFKQTGFTLHAELNILTGIVAYSIMTILAICSINSIGKSLNWSEWSFIQSKCGILCLAISLAHDIIMFSRFIIEKDVHKYTNKQILTRVKFYTLWIPAIVLCLRFVFSCFKPINQRIYNIRNGVYTEKSKRDCNEEQYFIEKV